MYIYIYIYINMYVYIYITDEDKSPDTDTHLDFNFLCSALQKRFRKFVFIQKKHEQKKFGHKAQTKTHTLVLTFFVRRCRRCSFHVT